MNAFAPSPRYAALLSAQHQLKGASEALEGVEAHLCHRAVELAAHVNVLLIKERERVEAGEEEARVCHNTLEGDYTEFMALIERKDTP